MLDSLISTLLGTLPTMRYYVTGVGIFLIAEWIFPAAEGQPWRDRATSFALSLIYCALIPFAIYLPTHYISEPILQAMGQPLFSVDLDKIVGDGKIGWLVRNVALPFVPVLVVDFFYYWTHRLQHRVPALWAQHKLHHTEYALCAASALRHHWLEETIKVFTVWIPIGVLIKITAGGNSFLLPILAYWGFFIHANLRLPLGPLTRVFSGPQIHRLHHSALPEHFDKNFAANFPIWDILFGTYCHPRSGEWPPTGMADGERIRGVMHGLILPFDGILLKFPRGMRAWLGVVETDRRR